MLVSTGPTGGALLFAKTSPGGSGGVEVDLDESCRLEWSSPVASLFLQMPFLISFLTDAVEIHDIGTLMCLQRIPSAGALCVSPCAFAGARNRNRGFGMFVSTADALSHFSMVTLPQQVPALVFCVSCGMT
jgi:hypothetical protein